MTWDTTSGTPDGNYDLRVVTTDNAGNTFTSPLRTVDVDNTKPVPTSLTLNNGSGQTLGQINNTDFVTIGYSSRSPLRRSARRGPATATTNKTATV